MDKYTRGLQIDTCNSSYNFNGPKTKLSGFGMQNGSDPEAKRKKRVAAYNVLAVEGRVKESVRNGFKWLKAKYCEIRYGW